MAVGKDAPKARADSHAVSRSGPLTLEEAARLQSPEKLAKSTFNPFCLAFTFKYFTFGCYSYL